MQFMEIFFLGTGGGRINLIKQVRGTGGFRINSSSANIHVDPGPGALVYSVKNKLDLLSLDCVIVTHNHVDHVTDANALIEGMTHYGLKKRGIIIGSRCAIEGGANTSSGISTYHLSKADEVYIAKWGERKRFATGTGSFEIESLRLKHEEPTTFGFKMYIDGKVIGYISDTDFIDSLGRDFKGCDVLVINCMKPKPDKYEGHLDTTQVVKVLAIAKPKACIITHMGMKILREGPAQAAQRIEKESGVKTIAARDGMRFSL